MLQRCALFPAGNKRCSLGAVAPATCNIISRQIASFASTNCNRPQKSASLGPAALQILNSSMSGTEHKCASNASPLAWINGKLAETMKFPRLGTCCCCFWTLQHLSAKQKLHVGFLRKSLKTVRYYCWSKQHIVVLLELS